MNVNKSLIIIIWQPILMQMNGSVLKNGLKVFTTFKYLSIDVQLLASYFEKIKLLEMIFFLQL